MSAVQNERQRAAVGLPCPVRLASGLRLCGQARRRGGATRPRSACWGGTGKAAGPELGRASQTPTRPGRRREGRPGPTLRHPSFSGCIAEARAYKSALDHVPPPLASARSVGGGLRSYLTAWKALLKKASTMSSVSTARAPSPRTRQVSHAARLSSISRYRTPYVSWRSLKPSSMRAKCAKMG